MDLPPVGKNFDVFRKRTYGLRVPNGGSLSTVREGEDNELAITGC